MRRALVALTAASLLAVCMTTSFTSVASQSPAECGTACQRPRAIRPRPRPQFRGTVPTPQQVLGYPLGDHEATNEEIGRYWAAVDRASDRVVTGVYATSWEGRPLRYALVGNPSTLDRLPAIRRDLNGCATRRRPTPRPRRSSPYPSDPVDRGERPRQRAVRRGRRPQAAVQPRRPLGLRRSRDPRPRDRRPDPGAEPGRARARHALQRPTPST